ncbi:MAG: hypothetical protein ACI85O_002792 [Saprospiraceae bacterium]|jgi:hypothetical protein
MKNLLILLLAIPMFSFTTTGEETNIDAITKALSSGDAETLGSFFDESVEVAILDVEDIYDKPEAIQKVKSFFSQNKPSAFSQVHQGSSKGNDSQYCIGNMTAGGKTFRVYVYLGNTGNKTLIQEIRFDKG